MLCEVLMFSYRQLPEISKCVFFLFSFKRLMKISNRTDSILAPLCTLLRQVNPGVEFRFTRELELHRLTVTVDSCGENS
ncbi:hypothetical protein Hlac_3211 [Halorubrum lacusprofundi ATCC 49239]|uniref:Uncharacterized protein n=1 Tax=Halorubrum lacusprofundi (strain ATCC 49239 / DSM 5036 / JCM 8891 / ACAM 34) TaxID=416348 RepID=B9LVN2_HALLT|nr:hypothetical protein Hlac_3211 [Halorubrum lacusprofundi ATCC 49239]